MARCMENEKHGRAVFYGAMVAEGMIALVWAAAGVSCYESSRALLDAGAGCSAVVYEICQSTMGKFGCLLAMLGVIVCPISSGDTAYRAARLTLADWLKLDQSNWRKRLLLTLPLLACGAVICQLDYSVVWRYFSWSNQTLAMISLWSASIYLSECGRNWHMTAIPATFMTAVTSSYFFCAPECLGMLWSAIGLDDLLVQNVSVVLGIAFSIVILCMFARKRSLHDGKTDVESLLH